MAWVAGRLWSNLLSLSLSEWLNLLSPMQVKGFTMKGKLQSQIQHSFNIITPWHSVLLKVFAYYIYLLIWQKVDGMLQMQNAVSHTQQGKDILWILLSLQSTPKWDNWKMLKIFGCAFRRTQFLLVGSCWGIMSLYGISDSNWLARVPT